MGTAVSKKSRKHGRYKKKCEMYERVHQRERNKKRKLMKHLKMHPNDVSANAALKNVRKVVA